VQNAHFGARRGALGQRRSAVLRLGEITGADDLGDFASLLASDDLAALLALGAMRSFRRGQALLHQQQVPNLVLLLSSGRVKVTAATSSGGELGDRGGRRAGRGDRRDP
jgi:CRP-like cAMP-binding protein